MKNDENMDTKKEVNIMVGPLEFIAIEFPGSHFKGEIMPVLSNLVSRGFIRILDLVFIRKDANGSVTSFEMNEIKMALYFFSENALHSELRQN
jgi:hypothetical protein